MIGQYLSNKNESATVVKSEIFFETKQGLNRAPTLDSYLGVSDTWFWAS